jgi:hypothetical protein
MVSHRGSPGDILPPQQYRSFICNITKPLDPHSFITITAVDGHQNTATAALSVTR